MRVYFACVPEHPERIEIAGGICSMPESQPVEIATIGREELQAKIARKDKFALVETLPAQYYSHDHLPGAINLPPDQIAQLAPKVLPDKTAEIIVYCAKLT
jgi:hypothetical protein